jgi:hypothetical protein
MRWGFEEEVHPLWLSVSRWGWRSLEGSVTLALAGPFREVPGLGASSGFLGA